MQECALPQGSDPDHRCYLGPGSARRRRRRRCASVFLALLVTTGAQAHSWYDARCCSGRDCHPVPCEQLTQNRDGSVTFGPTGVHVFRENVLPSLDAQCHLCTSKPERNEGYGYCAYLHQGS